MAPKTTLMVVPREIRDNIYSYLLNGETISCTDTKQRGSVAKRRFELSVLSVNKQIHDEAREYLFKQHTFVLVTHQCLAFNSNDTNYNDGLLHQHQLPVVTADYKVATNFNHATLHIDIRCNRRPWLNGIEVARLQEEWGIEEAPAGAFLITARELRALCQMLQCRYWTIESPAVLLASKVAGVTASRVPVVRQESVVDQRLVSTRVNFHKTVFKSATPMLESSVLATLQNNLVGACQEVQLTGFSLTPAAARSVAKRMAPDIINVSALAWSILQYVREVKGAGDKSFLQGDVSQALLYYRQLSHNELMDPLFSDDFHHLILQDHAFANHALQTALILSDASLVSAFIGLRQHDCNDGIYSLTSYNDIYISARRNIPDEWMPQYADGKDPSARPDYNTWIS